ncbi:Abi family protein, partial [Acinetobacter baumannii]
MTPQKLVTDYLVAKKGLSIQGDEIDFAGKVLSQINWYHLKIYFYPFIQDLNAPEEKYKPQTKFSDGWNIYLLDDDLRKIIIKYTLKIEIISKSYIDQAITEFTNDPFWYVNDD